MWVTDIDHLQIAAPEGLEAQARHFFGDLLGLQEIEKPAPFRLRGGCWFKIGSRQLHIDLTTVEIIASRPLKSEGVSGRGVVATLIFEAKTAGRFPVSITKAAFVRPNQQLTAASGSEVTVSVQ